jgi:curli production assembly/transport component CsgG
MLASRMVAPMATLCGVLARWQQVQAGVFRFIDYQRLLEGEIGYTSNEPVMLCLMSAIETGVIFLINDGIDRGLWDLQNKNDVKNDILVKYRQMSVPPES